MQSTLQWKKGLFKCTYELSAAGFPVGHLKDSELSRKAYGRLNNKEVTFQRCEGLHTRINMLETQSNRPIGTITFNPWYPKATIHLEDQQFYWTFSNIWETRWKITDQDGAIVHFRGWSGRGEMTILEQDDLLVLTGLYISSYYWRLAAIMIAIIFPVIFFPLLS
ncbi:hypothetical protein [Flavilitoribacter nigricans]|uniref:Uncharacterized protein n=1 Tax=Flavilitoribacter nigricans (strain ATCC 23147 / DSM 23189 / NBRC 102662 / NCIMB 1420 / SS-2) TaxID=1122177 RepID=A0A2D0MX84_FLAN2|nr:hypothetical protein [Flavilitoribacter nigricans]PHN00864.1 hypothetical protein CRP01_39950 [Flavilitoribacter nigricans DSM 23189 = NBRC 102662]